MVPIGAKWAVPTRFVAHVDDPSQPYRVHLDIRVVGNRGAEVLGFWVEVRDLTKPESVTAEGLRKVRLAACVRAAIEEARTPLLPRPDLGKAVFQVAAGSPTTAWGGMGGRPQRGRRIDDDFLRDVAKVYREARAGNDRAPVEQVARQLHGERSSAGRWVMLARQRGFLGPAIGTKAGEEPTNKKGSK